MAISLDCFIARLRSRGVLGEPQRPRKAAQGHRQRLRQPGALVPVDRKQVSVVLGESAYQFGGVDCFTRRRVVALAPGLTSAQGGQFLKRLVSTFPFPVQAVQSDGGTELPHR